MTFRRNSLGWWAFAVSVLYVLSLRGEIEELQQRVETLQSDVLDERHKVEELRDLVEAANTRISDAKTNEGLSYEEINEALENLEEIEIP